MSREKSNQASKCATESREYLFKLHFLHVKHPKIIVELHQPVLWWLSELDKEVKDVNRSLEEFKGTNLTNNMHASIINTWPLRAQQQLDDLC